MISIVIPVYNQQDYLADALDSLYNQTARMSNFELIVVDDGSTDNSLQIAKSYQDDEYDGFLKVIHQVNKGLASARNTGIMNARGDYVFFLDADDMLSGHCIEKIIETINETHADIIAPSFKNFGMNNESIILMESPTIEDFKTANRIGYCSAIKRSVLLEVGGYSPRMVWGAEDYALWFDLLKRGKTLVTIPEVLWLYRVKENSMWTETQKHQEEFMAQIKKDNPEVFK